MQSGRVGLFDLARSVLGLQKTSPRDSGSAAAKQPGRGDKRAKKDGRPPLPNVTESASATIEDALAARAAGAFEQARSILAEIDKGQGLRTVLRAAAALEAGDAEEVERLLPAVRKEAPPWQLTLQVAAVLEAGHERDALVRDAVRLGAPAWSTAWLRALSADEAERRAGLVDLLFDDPALARTVAARDLGVSDVKVDNDAIRRYAAFAHGRDIIRRFGPQQVATLLARAGRKSR
ncbi:MAG TPA: hypothetical protein VF881_07780 [Polyangiaceae bacterium]